MFQAGLNLNGRCGRLLPADPVATDGLALYCWPVCTTLFVSLLIKAVMTTGISHCARSCSAGSTAAQLGLILGVPQFRG